MIQKYNTLVAYIDGAARGNPGPSGIGVVIYSELREPVKEIYKFVGSRTNNQAEYLALQEALHALQELGARYVTIYSDSQLIVRQMTGEYEVKDKELQELYIRAKSIADIFNSFQIIHVPREQNKEADKLANKGIDEVLSQGKTVPTIERRHKQQHFELCAGENIEIILPNKSTIRPLALEMLKLLKNTFCLNPEQIESARDQLEITVTASDIHKNLQIILEHNNGQPIISVTVK